MGRSRGGLTSKIHALVDAEGRPVSLRLTGGQVADCVEADALTDCLGEGDILLADKGYDSDAIRAKAAQRKAWANIPPKINRKGSFSFSKWVYRRAGVADRRAERACAANERRVRICWRAVHERAHTVGAERLPDGVDLRPLERLGRAGFGRRRQDDRSRGVQIRRAVRHRRGHWTGDADDDEYKEMTRYFVGRGRATIALDLWLGIIEILRFHDRAGTKT